jgi:hypothetical protein
MLLCLRVLISVAAGRIGPVRYTQQLSVCMALRSRVAKWLSGEDVKASKVQTSRDYM